MLARPLRPCAYAHAPCVAAAHVSVCEGVQWRHLRMGHELRHEYVCTCHRTCRHMYIIPRRTPRIPNIFDSLRLLSSHIYRRGKHAGAEVSPVRREPQGMCSHAHSARAPALMHRVCCCRKCFMVRPRSMATSPIGTRAPSRICKYVPSHLPSYAYIPR